MTASDFMLLMIAPIGATIIGAVIGVMSWREREEQRSRRVTPSSPFGVIHRYPYPEPPSVADPMKPANVNAGDFHTEQKLNYPEARLAP